MVKPNLRLPGYCIRYDRGVYQSSSTSTLKTKRSYNFHCPKSFGKYVWKGWPVSWDQISKKGPLRCKVITSKMMHFPSKTILVTNIPLVLTWILVHLDDKLQNNSAKICQISISYVFNDECDKHLSKQTEHKDTGLPSSGVGVCGPVSDFVNEAHIWQQPYKFLHHFIFMDFLQTVKMFFIAIIRPISIYFIQT